MPIERNHNKESDLIIGNNFPLDDEETFASDAAHHREVSSNLRTVSDEIGKVHQRIDAEMEGRTAQTYGDSLLEQNRRVNLAADEHDNIATGLEVTASNIATAKANLNHIDDNFHTNMSDLQTWGQENNRPQHSMNEERTKLIEQAQSDARGVSTELSSYQGQVAADLAAGRPIDASKYSMQLSDGARSTPIIDNKGAGYALSPSTQGSAARFGSATRPTNSAGSSTGLSSATGSTLDRTATAGATGGVATPLGGVRAGQGGPVAGQNQPAAMPGVMGLGGLAGGTAGVTGAASAAAAGIAGTGSARAGAPAARATITRADVPEYMSEWTDEDVNMSSVAVTIWNDLRESGWDSGIALARVQYGDSATLVWTTDLGAAFIPETLHTNLAHPVDLGDVTEDIRNRMGGLPAADAMQLYLGSTGAKVAEQLTVASVGPAPQSFKAISTSQALDLVASGFLLTGPVVDSESLLPAITGSGDYTDAIARFNRRLSGRSVDECLLNASLSLTGPGGDIARVMPDGSSEASTTYSLEAVTLLIKNKQEEGDEKGLRNLLWQAELLDAAY